MLLDELHATPIALVTGADGRSIRAFAREIDGQALELLDRVGSSPARFIDAETGSEWDISGRAVAGPLAGRQLRRVPLVSDDWFDWRTHNPKTTVYKEWRPRTMSGGARPQRARGSPSILGAVRPALSGPAGASGAASHLSL